MTQLRGGIALAVLMLGAAVAPARAEPVTGHIQIGNPVQQAGIGVTELADRCEPGGGLEGFDGRWFTVSPGQRVTVSLVRGSTTAEDLDVYFYDAACRPIAEDLATPAVSESGFAPAGAAFLIVNLFSGADATFTLTLV